MSTIDNIYSKPLDAITSFSFNDDVANVFPDMIKRSVPGYPTIINMLQMLAQRYVKENTNCYDLGCSLGAASLSLQKGLGQRNCRIFAIDNSPAMIEKCQRIIIEKSTGPRIELICDDICNVQPQNASLIVMNFTLQFIDKSKRDLLIKAIFDGLNEGGIFILSEKIFFEHNQADELFTEMHHSFKQQNGYSDLEISQKRTALEDVLIPESLKAHQKRLDRAGFENSDVWFQCFNFASIIAWK